MNVYVIEPRDPLIVRDGRPFGPNPGARATSLPFPFPSTTTGGIRTRAGMKGGIFDTKPANIAYVKGIAVRGPFLVEVTDNDVEWFAPAPADALLLNAYDSEDKLIPDKAKLKVLHPLPKVQGVLSNIPDDMQLVGLLHRDDDKSVLQKPYKKAPEFWCWEKFKAWLEKPVDHDLISVGEQGVAGLPAQTRMHVAIDPGSQTGVDGALFMTSGREFTRRGSKLSECDHPKNETEETVTKPKPKNGYKLSECGRLALAVIADTDIGIKKDEIAPLGGERRLMSWRKETISAPTLPDKVKECVVKNKQCRLILMTPAYFDEGWKPTWVIDEAQKQGVTIALKAAAVQRPQVVSGWDFAYVNPKTNRRGRPKKTRRLAPAGSVYYFSVDGDDTQIEAWLDSVWMRPISDDDDTNPRNDGFGVAVVGNWHKED